MTNDEIVLYKKVRDYGGCSCMATLLLFTFFVMIIVSYFSDEKGALHISLYAAGVLLLALLGVKLIAYKSKHEAKTMRLKVSEEGLHYYEHLTFIEWRAITDIQIINRELSVSVGTSPALDFKLNLLDTDLEHTYDDFCQLLNKYYYPKSIYTYETWSSCGC